MIQPLSRFTKRKPTVSLLTFLIKNAIIVNRQFVDRPSFPPNREDIMLAQAELSTPRAEDEIIDTDVDPGFIDDDPIEFEPKPDNTQRTSEMRVKLTINNAKSPANATNTIQMFGQLILELLHSHFLEIGESLSSQSVFARPSSSGYANSAVRFEIVMPRRINRSEFFGFADKLDALMQTHRFVVLVSIENGGNRSKIVGDDFNIDLRVS